MSEDIKDENAKEITIAIVADGLTEKIKNFIRSTYNPTHDAATATMRLTTLEIYANIQRIYPNIPITEKELAIWLHESGYTFWDAGSMRFEWLLMAD